VTGTGIQAGHLPEAVLLSYWPVLCRPPLQWTLGALTPLQPISTRYPMKSSPPPNRVRKPLRAPGFDYATPGMYLVTICVHHMEPRFGTVRNGRVLLNDAGNMVITHWESIPERNSGVHLDAYVVMPNHLHGIIQLPLIPEGVGESLGTIVGTFKSLVTVDYSAGVRAGQFPRFDRSLWLRGFQDRIIRDDRMLDTLRAYVEGNPGRWQERHGSSSG